MLAHLVEITGFYLYSVHSFLYVCDTGIKSSFEDALWVRGKMHVRYMGAPPPTLVKCSSKTQAMPVIGRPNIPGDGGVPRKWLLEAPGTASSPFLSVLPTPSSLGPRAPVMRTLTPASPLISIGIIKHHPEAFIDRLLYTVCGAPTLGC